MTNEKMANEEIKFENQDLQIFNISDPRLKVDTLQKYFFPRLERLLDDTLDLARKIYGESILEDYTYAYYPSHRPTTKVPRVGDAVLIGLSGKRKKEPLIIKHQNNEPYRLTPAYIHYVLNKSDGMWVRFSMHGFGDKPSQLLVNESVTHFKKLVAEMFSREEQKLQKLFMASYISYLLHYHDFKSLPQIAGEQLGGLWFQSAWFSLPIDRNRGLESLGLAFITLMPIWYAINQIARTGEERYFSQHLDSLITWSIARYKDDEPEDTDDESESENAGEAELDNSLLENLDSYKFVRTRRWYQILARDNWTCQSCGRSSQKDGIILHVDHIMPRSKGGTNDDDNLQTLCRKCNIGKSNLDDTNLRELSE